MPEPESAICAKIGDRRDARGRGDGTRETSGAFEARYTCASSVHRERVYRVRRHKCTRRRGTETEEEEEEEIERKRRGELRRRQ